MSDEVKKGLMGIVVDETTISQVMPEINSLTYRGYKVQDLCEKCIFEEVAYLVLNGELPRSKELKKFINEERNNRKLSKQILNDIKNMPKKAHPMDAIRSAVSLMGLEDKDASDNSPKANMRKAMRIFAKTPTALAAFYRIRKGKKIINRFDDMKNVASNRLETWLEEDEDINQNLDFKQKSFYNEDIEAQSFSDKKADDPWI